MEPLITIIVPVYNVERYLSRCLDSIVTQTYRNLEIILVDDGSPDNCGAICDCYAEKDGRIRVIHQENAGVAAARNAALDCMTGEYVMFVDSDDWISKDAVQVLYERMMQDGSDMAVGRHIDVFDDETENDGCCKWMSSSCYLRQEVIAMMGKRDMVPVSVWAKLFKKSAITDLCFPNLKMGEDMLLFWQVLQNSEKVSTSDHIVYYYWYRKESAMHSISESARIDCLNANIQMTGFLRQYGTPDGEKKWFHRCINEAFLLNNKKAGVKLIGESFRRDEVHEMLAQQDIKRKMKWLGIKIPALGKAMLAVNDFLKRKQ